MKELYLIRKPESVNYNMPVIIIQRDESDSTVFIKSVFGTPIVSYYKGEKLESYDGAWISEEHLVKTDLLISSVNGEY